MPEDEHEQQGHTWYVRRDGKVHGPYPEGVIGSYLILGRITTDDEISHDRLHWLPLASHPELLPDIFADDDVDPAQLMAARRWHDERRYLDRRMSNASVDALPEGNERRRSRDRRGDGDGAAHRRREAPAIDVGQDARHRQGDQRRAVLTGLVVLAVIGIAIFWRLNIDEPVQDTSRDCQAAAAPGVNWNHCNMAGILLAEADLVAARLYNIDLQSARLMKVRFVDADLSYANLSGADLRDSDLRRAQLIGADLRNADLTGSRLQNANLLYADLRGATVEGAQFDGTQLGHAIWIDGRLCSAGSVGHCDHGNQ